MWETAIETASSKIADIGTGQHCAHAGMLAAYDLGLLPLDATTTAQVRRTAAASHLPLDRAMEVLTHRGGRTALMSFCMMVN